jgi:class 3 adenylate cyclase
MPIEFGSSNSKIVLGGFAGDAMSETRKLAAILVADVVGYGRLAGADEERTLARLRALRFHRPGDCNPRSRIASGGAC